MVLPKFDDNTWYQVLFQLDGTPVPIGGGSVEYEAVHWYYSNASDPLQQWQILTLNASSSTPTYMFRLRNLVNSYLEVYCSDPTTPCNQGTNTRAILEIEQSPNTVGKKGMWSITDSNQNDNTYRLVNQQNATNYFLDQDTNAVVFLNNGSVPGEGGKWTFSSISAINNAQFSTSGAISAAPSTAVPTTSMAIPTTTGDGSQFSALPTSLGAGGTSPSPTASSNSTPSTTGAIAGGVVGGVVALGLVGAAFWLFRRRKQRQTKDQEMISQDTYKTEMAAPSYYAKSAYQPPMEQPPQELSAAHIHSERNELQGDQLGRAELYGS